MGDLAETTGNSQELIALCWKRCRERGCGQGKIFLPQESGQEGA